MTVPRSQIENFKGCNVRIEYHVEGKVHMTRRGIIKRIGLANIHIEQESGRHYRIPVHSVSAIKELVA